MFAIKLDYFLRKYYICHYESNFSPNGSMYDINTEATIKFQKMAKSNLIGLEIETIGENRCVLFCKIILAEFNEISDDYAFTHAIDFAKLFTAAWWKNDTLEHSERVNKCKNQAWSKLSDED